MVSGRGRDRRREDAADFEIDHLLERIENRRENFLQRQLVGELLSDLRTEATFRALRVWLGGTDSVLDRHGDLVVQAR